MFFNKLMQILSYDEETELDDAAVAIEQHRKRLQDECIEYVRSIRDIKGLTPKVFWVSVFFAKKRLRQTLSVVT